MSAQPRPRRKTPETWGIQTELASVTDGAAFHMDITVPRVCVQKDHRHVVVVVVVTVVVCVHFMTVVNGKVGLQLTRC